MYNTTESDWKKFRAKLPVWQESYMDKINKEYIAILQTEEPASTRFWALVDRIKDDRKRPGVQLSVRRAEMEMDLFYLLREGVITEDDFDDFSEELSEKVKALYKSFMD